MRFKIPNIIQKPAFVIFLCFQIASCQHLGAAGRIINAETLNIAQKGENWRAILDTPPDGNSQSAQAERILVREWQNVSEERRNQAIKDADPNMFMAFSPVLGADFTAENHAKTAEVLGIVKLRAVAASVAAKNNFDRPRPFQSDNTITTCPNLPMGKSYPSSHSTLGWASALVLAEIYPEKADEILSRGREFGNSRIICGFHYPSDVAAGRVVGSIVFLNLLHDSAFLRLLEDAKRQK